MGNNNHKLPKRLVTGATKNSQEAKVPITGGGQGNIGTNINIRWTRRKATIAATLFGIPFLLGTTIAFKSGNILAGLFLVFLIAFIGLVYWALRYIEANEF